MPERGVTTLGSVKRVALLGATGSIGRQALEIVDAHPELELCAVATGLRADEAREIAEVRGVRHVSIDGDPPLDALIGAAEPDVVLNAVVGFAGLPATLAALEAGIDLALANKESLVAGGDLASGAWERGGGRLLPVDSEHSALFQCLQGRAPETVQSLVLTASGGPFRETPLEALRSVTREQALNHPTWRMGDKITIDSATLMNKGLEVIEAHWLFGFPAEQIDIVVHPQSIVHSLVELCDGSVLAQMGVTDMRHAIQYALTYPRRLESPCGRLDLLALGRLEFFAPDTERFPAIRLAYEALRAGGTYPAALNAANEEAVAAFLDGALDFLGIPRVVEAVLEAHDARNAGSLDAVLEADRWAREAARARFGAGASSRL